MDKDRLQELVQRAQDGDGEAYELLYHEFYPMVYSIAYKISHSDADAKDIAQNTFIQVKQSLHNLNDPMYFRLWLQKVTMSKCKNLFRKNHIATCDIDDHISDTQMSLHNQEYDPVHVAHFQNDKEILHSLIQQLPSTQAIVIYKMYFEQKTLEEIAKELQIPLGTVKSRAHVAKKQLLQSIQKYEEKNNCKLDFHSGVLESAVGGSLVHSLFKSVKGCGSSLQFGSMNLSLLLCGGIFVASASFGVYKAIQSSIESSPKETLRLSYPISKEVFSPVWIDGISYDDAADAYYYLKAFAHCNIELEQKTVEEKMEVLQLYEELKKYKGTYWNLLVESGWVKEYEKK